jgi:hypothetical protein
MTTSLRERSSAGALPARKAVDPRAASSAVMGTICQRSVVCLPDWSSESSCRKTGAVCLTRIWPETRAVSGGVLGRDADQTVSAAARL